MNLNKLYEKQAKLDKHILDKHNIKMSKEELLDNTVMALLVEVGELANTTRCFKHWSTKGMMDKEIVLDEFADCLHFYLSIGNQLNVKFQPLDKNPQEIEKVLQGWEKILKVSRKNLITKILLELYRNTSTLLEGFRSSRYDSMGKGIYLIGKLLKFTDKEVEQAYLKKHEENYKRQREGY